MLHRVLDCCRRMTPAAVVVLAILGVAQALTAHPVVIKHLHGGGIEVSFDEKPGVIYKTIKYKVDGTTASGKFTQENDGRWYHRNSEISFVTDNLVKYKIEAVVDGTPVQFLDTAMPESSIVMMPPKKLQRRGHVVFRDDFNGGTLNTNEWNYEISMYGGYNWEIQAYTNDPKNVFLRNGHLYLKPTLTTDDSRFTEQSLTTGVMDMTALFGSCTNADRYGCHREGRNGLLPPVWSGKITTKKTVTFGRVEVRAKLPQGDWIWPAIWMLPKQSVYGGWPRSGEIDIMESRGNSRAEAGGVNHGSGETSSTLHWGPDGGQNRYSMTHGEKRQGNPWGTGYHIFSVDWTADHIIAYVDNQEVLHVNTPPQGFWHWGGFHGTDIWSHSRSAPFDQAFYLILNVAIGGTNGFFPDGWHYNSPKPWLNTSPTENADFWNKRHDWLPSWHGDDVAMIVDYIEMTQY